MVSPCDISHESPGTGLTINFDSVSGLPQPKRRKTTVACEICRVRKSKCDGVRPTCGPCSRRKNMVEECFYTEDKSHNGQRTSPSDLDGGIDFQSTLQAASVSRQAAQYAPSTSSQTR